MDSLERMFSDPDFSLPGGESSRELQIRAIGVFEDIRNQYEGKRIAIGTHGNIMTVIMNYYNSEFDYDFFKQTTKPDIYKMIFKGDRLIEVERLWN